MWRAKIALATADGHGTNEIVRRTGMSKPCVWRWQERYVAEGVDGLLRDETRPPGRKPLPIAMKRKVLAKRDAAKRDALYPSLDGSRDGHQPVWGASGPKPA
jgi:transposase